MSTQALQVLKEEFRKWYGMISVEELVSNHELVEFIRRIEKYFALSGA
ncbi:MAG: hypothetical protein HOO06_05095 [Bdellovibrionaceae bacterium]|jgi:hypothetical protein|nr:hypothetical protein [Pseudobdellovibrionaceae bacterium]